MGVKVLFLDYDGVIADSMGAKAEALADAFAPYTQDRAGVADGFRRHAGSGRELIFDRIYEDLIGKPLDAPTRQRILGAFLDRIDAINRGDRPLPRRPPRLSKARQQSGSWRW